MQTINFQTSKAAIARPDFYISVNLDLSKTLKSWKMSVFSYEWLSPDGLVKALPELGEKESARWEAVESAAKSGAAIDIPVLGIGIQDHVEIGSGKAVLCTLAALGLQTIPAHIPKSNEEDFKAFLADVA